MILRIWFSAQTFVNIFIGFHTKFSLLAIFLLRNCTWSFASSFFYFSTQDGFAPVGIIMNKALICFEVGRISILPAASCTLLQFWVKAVLLSVPCQQQERKIIISQDATRSRGDRSNSAGWHLVFRSTSGTRMAQKMGRPHQNCSTRRGEVLRWKWSTEASWKGERELTWMVLTECELEFALVLLTKRKMT